MARWCEDRAMRAWHLTGASGALEYNAYKTLQLLKCPRRVT